MTTIDKLIQSVQKRQRPEDVAALCLDLIGVQLNGRQFRLLEKAAKGSLRAKFGYSSMSQDFARPASMAPQLPTAARMFPDVPAISEAQASDIEAATAYLVRLNGALSKTFERHDFKADRRSHAQRREVGLDVSRRQYNKQFRHIAYMEKKLAKMRREQRKYEFTRISKTKLATQIRADELRADPDTACFVAYYAARYNLRSEFTNVSQVRPYDEIAQMLFERCADNPDATNWWAIAHIYPDAQVLARLSDSQRGELLGRWTAILDDIADLLREVWSKTNVNIETMIVQRGNDSTTWNQTAGAWNRAREAWFALLEALQMDGILDEMCPGKVPRLMAADVAYWHRISGGGLHPDTFVWAELPLPWEVLRGEKTCRRADVEAACERHGLKPEASGWTAARPRGAAVAFTPTPELVHGVTVGHPVLAKILREMGAYSGKKIKNVPAPELN